MDAAALTILERETEAECAVIRDAAGKATQRMSESSPGHLEAAAYELARLYNVFERLLERIAEEFETHFEKRGDFHEKLVQRLNLSLPGIRPAFIPADRLPEVRELRGFRHLTRHAYDLTLRSDRLLELTHLGQRLADELPRWCREFAAQVRAEQGWSE